MDKEKYSFELRRDFNLEDHFTATFQEARQRGDRLASRLGRTRLYAYNEHINMWDPVGTFLGHMRFVNTWGDQYIIKSDYTDLVKATNSAKFGKRIQQNSANK